METPIETTPVETQSAPVVPAAQPPSPAPPSTTTVRVDAALGKVEKLTDAERKALQACEATIQKGWSTFRSLQAAESGRSEAAIARSERSERRQLALSGMAALLTLVMQEAAHELLLGKCQALDSHLRYLLTRPHKRRATS